MVVSMLIILQVCFLSNTFREPFVLAPHKHSYSSVKDAYCSSPYFFNDRLESLLCYNHTVVYKLVYFAISYKLCISCKDQFECSVWQNVQSLQNSLNEEFSNLDWPVVMPVKEFPNCINWSEKIRPLWVVLFPRQGKHPGLCKSGESGELR